MRIMVMGMFGLRSGMPQLAPGDFSTSELANVQLKAQQMFADSQESRSYMPEVEALRAIREHQTATIQIVNDVNKDYDVAINWVDACAVVAEACEDNCTIDEPELETKATPYVIAPCRKSGFSVNRETLRSSIFSREEVAAKGQMAAVKELDEYFTQASLVKLKTFASTPASPTILGTYATGTLTIPAVNYNSTLVAKFIQFAILNRMRDNYIISNGELFNEFVTATFNQGNLDGKGTKAMFDALDLTFDLFNFAAAAITDDAFLIADSAVASAFRNRHTPGVIQEIGGTVQQTRYTVPSLSFPGVFYDAYYTVKCTASNQIVDVWRFEGRHDLFLNPAGCDSFGGVVSLSKGA